MGASIFFTAAKTRIIAGFKSLGATLPDEIVYWAFCFLNRAFR
jgi:hypothetical protein